MTSKKSRIKKGKSVEIPIEHNMAKFTSVEAKVIFDKAGEINNIFCKIEFGF